MRRIIYHGSDRILEHPYPGGGKPYNDYGSGFYCTENQNMAREWAAGPERNGFANRYEIQEEKLKILRLEPPFYNVLHWLAVLLENRTFDTYSLLAKDARSYIHERFLPDYESYDIIIGYRADDSYFSFAQDFLNGTISLGQLERSMRLGRLGEQYVLKSIAAFDSIRFLDYEAVLSEEWYLKRQLRDRRARRAYFDMEKNRRASGDLFITQLIDEDIKDGDERLRRAVY